MRIVFLGTPAVAVPALEALVAADDVEVVAVVTNPDRPKGRSKQLVPPPVKVAAERHGLPVWQPLKAREIADDLAALEVDACAIVAYGALLPRAVLDAGGRGLVNLHFSLLPRWRGAAPVQHAIRAGDEVTGVTCFVLDEGMDTGHVLATAEEPVRADDTAGTLLDRLAELGAPVLLDALRGLVAGQTPTPQPADGATLAPKVTPDDTAVDWAAPARALTDLIRSADPAPGAHTTFRGKRLKLWRVTPVTEHEGAPVPAGGPGEVVAVGKRGVLVACGDGAVRLDEIQPEGKGRVDGPAFVNGQRPEPGERLGPGERLAP